MAMKIKDRIYRNTFGMDPYIEARSVCHPPIQTGLVQDIVNGIPVVNPLGEPKEFIDAVGAGLGKKRVHSPLLEIVCCLQGGTDKGCTHCPLRPR